MRAVIELFNKLLDLWDRFKKTREIERRQRERDELLRDPEHWFDSNFGGMPDDKSDTTTKANDRHDKNG